jgi:hypothetical protein
MRFAIFLAMAAGLFSCAAKAQVAEPVRPPPVSPTVPTVTPPLAQPLPLNPPSFPLPQPPLPLPKPVPVPAAPLAVAPPPPPAAAESDAPDGSESCDCYVTEDVPVYENGVLTGSNSIRKWTGKSPQCCPERQ